MNEFEQEPRAETSAADTQPPEEVMDIAREMQDVLARGRADSYSEAFRYVTDEMTRKNTDQKLCAPAIAREGELVVAGKEIALVHLTASNDKAVPYFLLFAGYEQLPYGSLERISAELGPHWVPSGKIAVDISHCCGDEEESWYPGLDSQGNSVRVPYSREEQGFIPFPDNIIIPTYLSPETEQKARIEQLRDQDVPK